MNLSILSSGDTHLRICAAAALCTAAAFALNGRCDAAVDGTQERLEVLTIGSFNVTEACVEMNFRNFSGKTKLTLNKDQVHAWVQGFVQRQILTAEAINEGYDKRAEVVAGLRQMEEHMLTDSDGPLYNLLLREGPRLCSPDEVYAREATTYQLEVLEVPKSSPAHALASQLIGDTSPSEDTRVVDRLRGSGQVKYLQGPFVWPFVSVEAASVAICNAPVGRWQSVDDCDATVLFRIASKAQTSQAPRQRVEDMLAKMATHWALEDVHHKREMELMACGSLGFDWDAAEAIIVNLKAAKSEAGSELTAKMLGLPADRLLAQIESQEGRQVVSVSDYTQYYNSLFLRRLPERAIEVYDLVKDLLMFRRDLHEARKLGLDRAGDFPEHKENYRNELILNLYEKEQIRPKLHLGRAAAEDYYSSHRTDYQRPIRNSGRIYTFESVNAATAFAKATTNSNGKNGMADLPFEPLLATPDMTYAGVPPLCHIIFSPRKPKLVGPLPKGTQWIVWTWGRTLESVQVPFASVEQQIIQCLQQPLIGPFEHGLACALAAKLPINNRISEDRLLSKYVQHKERT